MHEILQGAEKFNAFWQSVFGCANKVIVNSFGVEFLGTLGF